MGPRTDFTIDKVSWHTAVKGNPETPDEVRMRFKIIVDFLQTNQLATRTLLRTDEQPTEEFAIKASDLTPEGLAVMKKGYDKWLKKVANRRKDLTDVSILESALREIRGK
ncbi:MAG TPA: hypothetical protein VKS79_25285 [Gemmataceae bacterium]|nr:hypothetical protein [Gemmataceae bacterium]